MKTYISTWFTSEGARPSEVVQKLEKLGFKKLTGAYDMEYDWGRNANVNDALGLADNVQKAMKDDNVMFKVETI
ncbi:MAG: hypothetical protein J4432_02830 [DPANN group archaeon]|nr:hypothetical protein [DPANN group archaeon]